MNNYKETYSENLLNKDWIGIIVDIDDPIRRGRVKARVFEKFDQRPYADDNGAYPDVQLTFDDYLEDEHFIISKADLPWIFPMQSSIFGGGENPGFGSFSTPKLKSLVKVKFSNNDIYSGEYTTIVRPNEAMMQEINNPEDYINSNVLLYDEDEQVKVMYKRTLGLQIFHKNSYMVIRPDSSIYIEHKDSESLIELKGPDIKIVSNRDIDITSGNKITVNSDIVHINGGDTYIGASPNYSALNGEPTVKAMKALARLIDGKTPATPGVATAIVDAAENIMLSKTVKTSS